MSHALRILPRAERDAQDIFNWINDRSPEGAHRWWDAFLHEANRAAAMPEAYTRAPESKATGVDLRQFVFKTRRGRTYRAVFITIEDEVRILRIRGPGQAPLSADEIECG